MQRGGYRLFVKLQGKGYNPAGILDHDRSGGQDNIDPTFVSHDDARIALRQWIDICRETDTPVRAAMVVSPSGLTVFYDSAGRQTDEPH